MARYINADKVQPDCMSTKGGVAISQSQLANQPTADVIERSKIDKAIKEIENAPTFDYKLHLTKTEVIRKEVVLEILKRNIGK